MRLISMLDEGAGSAGAPSAGGGGAGAAPGAGRAPATGEALASCDGPPAAAVWAANMRLIRGLATNRPISRAVTHRIAASMILNQ